MKEFKHYKDLTKTAVEEAVVDYEKGSKKKAELFDGILKSPGKYQKLVSALLFIKECMPDGLSKSLAKKLDANDYEKLPFNPEQLELKGVTGKGAVSKVFLLESKNSRVPSYVLKLGYKNFGSLDEILNIAKQAQKDYEKIRDIYKELPGFIPEEMTVLLSHRKNGESAVATIQKFLGNNLRDLFEDISREEFLELMRCYPSFRNDFIKFTEISTNLEKDTGEVIDLLGNKNLSITEKEEAPRLVFLDPHLISSTSSKDKDRSHHLKSHLAYLENIKREFDFNEIGRKAA